MLQTSVDIDLWPDQEWPQWNETTKSYNLPSTPAKQYFKDVYYSTNMVFMGIALGLTGVVILCILPSYWGFWQLGRDVTLGPLEIAYAFQGPAFATVTDVDGRADQVVKRIGRTKVQYGEIEDEHGRRLAFRMSGLPPASPRLA